MKCEGKNKSGTKRMKVKRKRKRMKEAIEDQKE